MKNIFFIFWIISIVLWLVYALFTVVNLAKNNREYLKDYTKMVVSYILTLLFYILMKYYG